MLLFLIRFSELICLLFKQCSPKFPILKLQRFFYKHCTDNAIVIFLRNIMNCCKAVYIDILIHLY